MDVSLESIPRKVLLYEKVSSLLSAQRLYISDPVVEQRVLSSTVTRIAAVSELSSELELKSLQGYSELSSQSSEMSP
jgi:hypothetical protein